MNSETVKINLKDLGLVMLGAVVVIILGIGMVGNADPLWFLPFFDETPTRVIIYRDGCHTDLYEGQSEFEAMKNALNQAFSQVEGWNMGYGLSADSLKQYREKERAVEVFYPNPVTIHSAYNFGHPTLVFIPLSSYFADSRAVFGGKDGEYWAGALRLKSIEPIQRTAEVIHCAP